MSGSICHVTNFAQTIDVYDVGYKMLLIRSFFPFCCLWYSVDPDTDEGRTTFENKDCNHKRLYLLEHFWYLKIVASLFGKLTYYYISYNVLCTVRTQPTSGLCPFEMPLILSHPWVLTEHQLSLDPVWTLRAWQLPWRSTAQGMISLLSHQEDCALADGVWELITWDSWE